MVLHCFMVHPLFAISGTTRHNNACLFSLLFVLSAMTSNCIQFFRQTAPKSNFSFDKYDDYSEKKNAQIQNWYLFEKLILNTQSKDTCHLILLQRFFLFELIYNFIGISPHLIQNDYQSNRVYLIRSTIQLSDHLINNQYVSWSLFFLCMKAMYLFIFNILQLSMVIAINHYYWLTRKLFCQFNVTADLCVDRLRSTKYCCWNKCPR